MRVKISLFTLVLSSTVFALSLPELPWDKVSIGIMDQEGASATFQKGNFTYGLDAMTFAVTMDLVGLSGFQEGQDMTVDIRFKLLVNDLLGNSKLLSYETALNSLAIKD